MPLGFMLIWAAVFWAAVAYAAFGYTVTHDNGGSINKRIEMMRGLDGVVIDGDCMSACTMFLGLPETCLTPRARLGFHSPRGPFYTSLSREDWERETRRMASFYPPEIAAWFMAEARYSRDLVLLSAKRAAKMGAKQCRLIEG